MFCSNCGKNNQDGMSFCCECGAALNVNFASAPQPSVPSYYEAQSYGHSKNADIIKIVVSSVVMICMIVFALCFSFSIDGEWEVDSVEMVGNVMPQSEYVGLLITIDDDVMTVSHNGSIRTGGVIRDGYFYADGTKAASINSGFMSLKLDLGKNQIWHLSRVNIAGYIILDISALIALGLGIFVILRAVKNMRNSAYKPYAYANPYDAGQIYNTPINSNFPYQTQVYPDFQQVNNGNILSGANNTRTNAPAEPSNGFKRPDMDMNNFGTGNGNNL